MYVTFQIPYLPEMAAPFVTLFGSDEMSAFEAVMSMFMWCGHSFHATYPHPPVHIIGVTYTHSLYQSFTQSFTPLPLFFCLFFSFLSSMFVFLSHVFISYLPISTPHYQRYYRHYRWRHQDPRSRTASSSRSSWNQVRVSWMVLDQNNVLRNIR